MLAILPAVLLYGLSFFSYSAATTKVTAVDADAEMVWIPAGSLSFFYSSAADAVAMDSASKLF
jgi:hypothetical protein